MARVCGGAGQLGGQGEWEVTGWGCGVVCRASSLFFLLLLHKPSLHPTLHQVELQGVALVVLSYFRDAAAAAALADTVAAHGGVLGAAVCCAENGGDADDGWTTCPGTGMSCWTGEWGVCGV